MAVVVGGVAGTTGGSEPILTAGMAALLDGVTSMALKHRATFAVGDLLGSNGPVG